MGIFSRRNKDDDSAAWHNKGNSLADLKRYEEAIGCYDKAIRIDPENYDAWSNKGNSLVILERYEEAIECIAKAEEAIECIAKAKELDES